VRFFGAAREHDDGRVVGTVAEVTGRAPGTLPAWAAANRDRFPAADRRQEP
jgi:hypothetical protein